MVFNNCSSRLPEIDSALQFISEIIHQLTNQKASIVDDIHSTFDELQKTLNVRKSVLLMELEVNYGLKHKVRLQLSLPISWKRRDVWGTSCHWLAALLLAAKGAPWVPRGHCCAVRVVSFNGMSSFFLSGLFSAKLYSWDVKPQLILRHRARLSMK